MISFVSVFFLWVGLFLKLSGYDTCFKDGSSSSTMLRLELTIVFGFFTFFDFRCMDGVLAPSSVLLWLRFCEIWWFLVYFSLSVVSCGKSRSGPIPTYFGLKFEIHFWTSFAFYSKLYFLCILEFLVSFPVTSTLFWRF